MTAKDLKNALLQEAVQGKLVPQIESEGNARDLLDEICKEKAILINEGKLKKEKTLAEIKEEEIPFDIPDSWCWCRFGDIFQHNTGKTQNSSVETKNGTLRKFITTSNLYWNEFDFTKVKEMLFSENELSKCTVTKGDLLICEGGEYGRSAIWKYDYDVCFQNHVHRARAIKANTLYVEFYFYLIYLYKNIGLIEGRGVGIKSLSTENLHQVIIPLPPFAEQKRIVAAIEKFMPLIEEYGKKETELKAFNEQIGTLTKKAILQEAVQGKLVPQIDAEGNAKDLLDEIKKEKAKLVEDGKLKKEKTLPEITEDEIPFDIPENWCWCRVGDLFSTMSGLGYKKDVLIEKTPKMIRVLRGGNILDTSYVFKDDDIMISDKYVKSELFLKKNYLITPAVTSLEHIGKIGYIEKDYDDTVVGGFVLMLIPYYSDEILSKYCLYLFGTRWFRDMCKEITHKSGQAFYNLSRDKLLNLVIPIAPLAEQKRIIDAIEKLLPLCERIGE